MIEVIVFAEGQTEEQFIKTLVAPALNHLQVYVKPQLLNTSRDNKGGALSFERLKMNARNTLRQHHNAILTTLIDLYALDTSFPEFEKAKLCPDVYSRVEHLEIALHDAIVKAVECRPDRFIAYIQPYEFEGLLFSDVATLSKVEPNWVNSFSKLEQVYTAFETPEHINDGYDTKPSKRLENLLNPKYKKTRHGPLAAKKITLEVIERECRHFKEWMDKLRALTN
ncbi:MAG: DUF4276 family protein [Thiotrichaceae bacterium]|nr:DUF4276 family protein [Thiotrichaceae bacterium]